MNRGEGRVTFLPTLIVRWEGDVSDGLTLKLDGPTTEQIEWLRQVLAEVLAQKGARTYLKGTLRAIGQDISMHE